MHSTLFGRACRLLRLALRLSAALSAALWAASCTLSDSDAYKMLVPASSGAVVNVNPRSLASRHSLDQMGIDVGRATLFGRIMGGGSRCGVDLSSDVLFFADRRGRAIGAALRVSNADALAKAVDRAQKDGLLGVDTKNKSLKPLWKKKGLHGSCQKDGIVVWNSDALLFLWSGRNAGNLVGYALQCLDAEKDRQAFVSSKVYRENMSLSDTVDATFFIVPSQLPNPLTSYLPQIPGLRIGGGHVPDVSLVGFVQFLKGSARLHARAFSADGSEPVAYMRDSTLLPISGLAARVDSPDAFGVLTFGFNGTLVASGLRARLLCDTLQDQFWSAGPEREFLDQLTALVGSQRGDAAFILSNAREGGFSCDFLAQADGAAMLRNAGYWLDMAKGLEFLEGVDFDQQEDCLRLPILSLRRGSGSLFDFNLMGLRLAIAVDSQLVRVGGDPLPSVAEGLPQGSSALPPGCLEEMRGKGMYCYFDFDKAGGMSRSGVGLLDSICAKVRSARGWSKDGSVEVSATARNGADDAFSLFVSFARQAFDGYSASFLRRDNGR